MLEEIPDGAHIIPRRPGVAEVRVERGDNLLAYSAGHVQRGCDAGRRDLRDLLEPRIGGFLLRTDSDHWPASRSSL